VSYFSRHEKEREERAEGLKMGAREEMGDCEDFIMAVRA